MVMNFSCAWAETAVPMETANIAARVVIRITILPVISYVILRFLLIAIIMAKRFISLLHNFFGVTV